MRAYRWNLFWVQISKHSHIFFGLWKVYDEFLNISTCLNSVKYTYIRRLLVVDV